MCMVMAVRMAVAVPVVMFVPEMWLVDVHHLHSTSFDGEVQPLGKACYWEV